MARWPHAPSHEVDHPGIYIVTAATLHHAPLFDSREKLNLLQDTLLDVCEELGWQPQQWAVFTNHYHLIGLSPEESGNSSGLTRRIHGRTAIAINKLDGTSGRTVWFDRWDTRISYERSYLARLNYVRTNAVRHGLARQPEDYPYCSAAWFAQNAKRSWFETISSFPVDDVNVPDDFYP